MIKSLFLVIVFGSSALVSFSQENSQTQKECRITGGVGFAGATKNTKSVGQDVWFQLDYKLSENISIATEFENMTYKQPGYYENLPVAPNEIKVIDNNSSLLLKYHIPVNSILKVALASGWTFTTRQSDYYIYESDSSSQHYFRNVTSFSDYRIPLLLEVEYPVSKKINIQARIKYNLNPQNGDTYSGGIGLSLKL
ncbi:MAG: outer membrane beta-barrel protein [Ginsengibacter sp.]